MSQRVVSVISMTTCLGASAAVARVTPSAPAPAVSRKVLRSTSLLFRSRDCTKGIAQIVLKDRIMLNVCSSSEL